MTAEDFRMGILQDRADAVECDRCGAVVEPADITAGWCDRCVREAAADRAARLAAPTLAILREEIDELQDRDQIASTAGTLADALRAVLDLIEDQDRRGNRTVTAAAVRAAIAQAVLA